MLGWNYRPTELDAVVTVARFGKLEQLTEHRVRLAEHLTARLAGFPGLTPSLATNCTHVYFVSAMKFDDSMRLPGAFNETCLCVR